MLRRHQALITTLFTILAVPSGVVLARSLTPAEPSIIVNLHVLEQFRSTKPATAPELAVIHMGDETGPTQLLVWQEGLPGIPVNQPADPAASPSRPQQVAQKEPRQPAETATTRLNLVTPPDAVTAPADTPNLVEAIAHSDAAPAPLVIDATSEPITPPTTLPETPVRIETETTQHDAPEAELDTSLGADIDKSEIVALPESEPAELEQTADSAASDVEEEIFDLPEAAEELQDELSALFASLSEESETSEITATADKREPENTNNMEAPQQQDDTADADEKADNTPPSIMPIARRAEREPRPERPATAPMMPPVLRQETPKPPINDTAPVNKNDPDAIAQQYFPDVDEIDAMFAEMEEVLPEEAGDEMLESEAPETLPESTPDNRMDKKTEEDATEMLHSIEADRASNDEDESLSPPNQAPAPENQKIAEAEEETASDAPSLTPPSEPVTTESGAPVIDLAALPLPIATSSASGITDMADPDITSNDDSNADEKTTQQYAPEGTPELIVLFDTGEIELPIVAEQDLNALAAMLNQNSTDRLQIIGYADEPPTVSGSEVTPRRTSFFRALAIRDYLTTVGIDNLRMEVRALPNPQNAPQPDRVEIYTTSN